MYVCMYVCMKVDTADFIRIDEVAAALKKMKRHKAPGLSGLVAEMIQGTVDMGTQWILDLYPVKWYCERRLHPRGLEVKCGITNLLMVRGSNGVWILQKN